MKTEEVDYLLKQNKINVSYDIWLNELKSLAGTMDFSLPCYDKTVVIERFLQMMNEKSYFQYNLQFDQLINEKKFNFNHLHVDFGSGKIKLPARLYFKNNILFLMYSLKYFSLSLFKWIFSNRHQKNQPPINILYSHGFDHLLKKELNFEKNFINSGPLNFLNSTDLLFVQSNEFKRINNVIFTPSIFLDLYRFIPITLKNFQTILSSFATVFFTYFFSIFRTPLLSIFYRDLIFQSVLEVFAREKILANIIITNSNVFEQILPFRSWKLKNFKTHIALYSVNSKPMKYIFHEDKPFAEYPYFKYLNVDEAWVWDNDQVEWIKKFNPLIVTHNVGPILFYLDRASPQINPVETVVTIFDITPAKTEHMKNAMGLHGYNYYGYDNMSTFMIDIMSEIDKLRSSGHKICVRIKPKRKYASFHDQNYISMINNFAAKKGLIILPPESDLYLTIHESDLILSIPFSSPPIIASHLKKKSLLYDPTGFVVNNYKLPQEVEFSSGKEDFSKKLINILTDIKK